jgi:hypothetical protein
MIDTDKYEGHTPAPWGTGCYPPVIYTPHEFLRECNEEGEVLGCHDLKECQMRSKEAYEREGEDSDGCERCGGPYLSVNHNYIIATLPPSQSNGSNLKLMTDAPLILEAYKRLRKELKEAKDVIQYALEMSSDDDSTRVFEDYLEVIE